jgi:peptide/nickel transport system substrate-binding protein
MRWWEPSPVQSPPGRRVSGVLAIVASVGLLAAACSGTTAPRTGAPASGGTAASGQTVAGASGTPQNGGTVVTTISGDPPTVNPDISAGVPDTLVGCMIYQGLIRIASDYTIEPLLAKSWQVSSDSLTYTFNLVNATWSDGQPFTSADVKFTLLNVSAKDGPHFLAAGSAIQSIDTPDAHTVVIHLSRAFGPFLQSLACSNNAGILPQHIFQGQDALTSVASLSKPVGTGPFMLTQYARGDHLTLARNPHYWQAGLPHLDQVILKEIPNPESRTLALKSGSINEIEGYYVQNSDIPGFKSDSKYQLIPQAYPTYQLAILNDREAPFNNAAVRQALYTAVDRQFIWQHVFAGLGSVPKSAIQVPGWAYNPSVDLTTMYAFDAAKAGSMLDAAGFPKKSDGYRFSMNLYFDSGVPAYAQTAQALASMWNAIGVNVHLVGEDRATVLQDVYTNWKFDAISVAYTTSGDPALGIARTYVTSSIVKQPFTNASGYSNPQVDQLFAAGQDSADQKARAAAYWQAQTVLAHDLPSLPLILTQEELVASSTVHGLGQGVTGSSWWQDVWVSH